MCPLLWSYCFIKLLPIFIRPIIACLATLVCWFCVAHNAIKKHVPEVSMFLINVWLYRSEFSMQYSKRSTTCSREPRRECPAHMKLFFPCWFSGITTQTSFSGKTKQRKENVFFFFFLEMCLILFIQIQFNAVFMIVFSKPSFFIILFLKWSKKMCKWDLYISSCNFALCSK